jgi:hypothetical protein
VRSSSITFSFRSMTSGRGGSRTHRLRRSPGSQVWGPPAFGWRRRVLCVNRHSIPPLLGSAAERPVLQGDHLRRRVRYGLPRGPHAPQRPGRNRWGECLDATFRASGCVNVADHSQGLAGAPPLALRARRVTLRGLATRTLVDLLGPTP